MQYFTSSEYLQIDMANNYGLDKSTWTDRLLWATYNENRLEQMVNSAKEPAQYYAAVKAYRAAMNGEAIGYPISLDATSSGIQILSVLTGDSKAARKCNVLGDSDRVDFYEEVYKAMQSAGLHYDLEMEDVKKAVMTAFYGSTQKPEELLGTTELLELFYATLDTLAPGPDQVNQACLDLWDPTAFSYNWGMPDNFHVNMEVTAVVEEPFVMRGEPMTAFRRANQPKEKGRALSANLTHSVDAFVVREMVRRCNYNVEDVVRVKAALISLVESSVKAPNNKTMVNTLWGLYRKTGYLSSRILEYLDHSNLHLVDEVCIWDLLDSLPEKPFELLCVHDCFRCLPQYGNELRMQYEHQMVLLAESDLLSHIMSAIAGRTITVNKISDLAADFQKEGSNYALS